MQVAVLVLVTLERLKPLIFCRRRTGRFFCQLGADVWGKGNLSETTVIRRGEFDGIARQVFEKFPIYLVSLFRRFLFLQQSLLNKVSLMVHRLDKLFALAVKAFLLPIELPPDFVDFGEIARRLRCRGECSEPRG